MTPPASNVFAAAIEWLEATVLGTVGSTVAVLAVASIGFVLLTGRMDLRRAGRIILGCFILFGASTIARGLLGVLGGSGPSPDASVAVAPPPVYPPAPAAAPAAAGTASAFDPYAGAALPTRP